MCVLSRIKKLILNVMFMLVNDIIWNKNLSSKCWFKMGTNLLIHSKNTFHVKIKSAARMVTKNLILCFKQRLFITQWFLRRMRILLDSKASVFLFRRGLLLRSKPVADDDADAADGDESRSPPKQRWSGRRSSCPASSWSGCRTGCPSTHGASGIAAFADRSTRNAETREPMKKLELCSNVLWGAYGSWNEKP